VEQPTPPAEVQTPAPEEVKDDKTIDFTSFLNAKNTVEEQKPHTPPKTTTPPATTPPVAPVVIDPNARDYTGVDEQDVPLFKKMANESFNRLKPLYLDYKKKQAELNETQQKLAEAQKGVTRIPDSYYEHPNAYILTPEFNVAAQTSQQAQAILNHWTDQLQKIREGAVEYTHIDFDQNGNLVEAKKPADAKAETNLLLYVNHAQNQLVNANANMQAIMRAHQGKATEVTNWVNNFAKQAFPYYDKPEAAVLKAELDAVVAQFPVALRNNPLMSALSRSLVTNKQLLNMMQEQMKNAPAAAAPRISEDQRKAGPTSSGAAAAGVTGKEDVTIDDFEKIKAGV